jgi:CreA protein
MGSNPRIEVYAFDDPMVANVTCFFTMPQQGGLMSDFGMSSERSDYSITCRATGPLDKHPNVPDNAEAFKEDRSPLFKTFRINRVYDRERNTLLYVVTTRVWTSGKSKSGISAISLNTQ